MTNDQNTTRGGTSLRRKVAIGAATAVATGALLGAGISAASATPVQGARVTATAVSSHSTHGDLSRLEALVKQVRATLFQGSINGAKAQSLAKRIANDDRLFSQLPSTLQSDITALADAPSTDRVADAQKIKTTALNGGYGEAIDRGATALQATADLPISTKLQRDIASDVSSGHGVGDIAAKIATTVSEDDALFGALPKALQSDVTTLAHAPASERVADVQKIVTSAFDGDYGQKLQTLVTQFDSIAQFTNGIGVPLQ